jgi:biotin carboxyl carrier protein
MNRRRTGDFAQQPAGGMPGGTGGGSARRPAAAAPQHRRQHLPHRPRRKLRHRHRQPWTAGTPMNAPMPGMIVKYEKKWATRSARVKPSWSWKP